MDFWLVKGKSIPLIRPEIVLGKHMTKIEKKKDWYIGELVRRQEKQATVMNSYKKKGLPDRQAVETSNRYEFLYGEQSEKE